MKSLLATLALTLVSSQALAAEPKEAREPAQPTSAQLQASQAEARRLSDAFVNVADRVGPSVVRIDTTVRDERRDEIMRMFGAGGDSPIERGTGSGVIFTADGAIVTNNHVLEGALTVNVHLRDGRFIPARVIGRDPATDIAVIKVDATGLVPAHFADSEAARVGEWVVAIGSPFGLNYSVTTGVLSAKGRGVGPSQIADYLQTDASINPGNSGGPLCNLEGQVLGINSMIKQGAGIGFAVPSNLARHVAEQLLKTGKVERPWVAAGLQDLNPDIAAVMKLDSRAGALVDSVLAGGPASKAQIQPGDVLASIGGRPVHDSREFIQETLLREVGQTVQVEVIRAGRHYGTALTFAARPEPAVPELPVQLQNASQSGLGLAVRTLTPEQSTQLGYPAHDLAMVSTAVPGSAADRAGLHPGDVIIEADGTPYPTTKQLAAAAEDGQLLLRLHRGDQDYYAALRK